MLVLIGH